MAWVRIDDGIHAHPKILTLSHEALGVWLLALAWSADQLTDGRIPRQALQRIGAGDRRLPKIAQELVDVGLWDTTDDGWAIHDFHDYQPTADEVRAGREAVSRKRSAAGRKGAAARWGDGKANGKPMAKGVALASQPDGKAMAPARPDPKTPPTPPNDPPSNAPHDDADGTASGGGTEEEHRRLVDAAMHAAAAHELTQSDEPVRSPDRWTAAKLKQYEPRRARALELAQAGAQLEGLGDFFITGQPPAIRRNPEPIEHWTDQQRAAALAESADTRAAIRATLAARRTTHPTEGDPPPMDPSMPELPVDPSGVAS